MTKRMLSGLLSAAMVGAMLPGVASADPDLVYVCHFPGHVNSDPETQGDFANDFAFEDPESGTAACEYAGGSLLRMPRAAAINGHGDNFPGP